MKLKKILSIILSFILCLGVSFASFSAVGGANSKTPLKLKQTVVTKSINSKNGTWKSVALTMTDVKQRFSLDPNNNTYVVQLHANLDTFKGNKQALLTNNFPIIYIGDNNYNVNFDELDSPLFGYKGKCKLNQPYKGENYDMPPLDSGSVTRVGEFNIVVPKNKNLVVFPVTFSNNVKVYFEFDQSKHLDLSKFVLKTQKTYGTPENGQFKTNLKLISEPNYGSVNVNIKKYALENANDLDIATIETNIVGNTKELNTERLEAIVKQKADELNYSMTKLNISTYKIEGSKYIDQYECIVYYDCDDFYRTLQINSSIKFQKATQDIVKSFTFDNSTVEFETSFVKAQQVNGFYIGTGEATKFKSTIQLYNEVDNSIGVTGKNDTYNADGYNEMSYSNADDNLSVEQVVFNRKILLSKYAEGFSKFYNQNSIEFEYFEPVKFEIGVFVARDYQGATSVVVLRSSNDKFEANTVLISDDTYSRALKEILASLFEQYGCKADLVDEILD